MNAPIAIVIAPVRKSGAFCKLRDDGTVPLICPTCQNVFAGFAQGIDASDHHATLHGVVFDILVESERPDRGSPDDAASASMLHRVRDA